MYKSFFRLKSNPFNTNPDPRFLFMMPHTREALAGLEYGISAHRGFIVLTGEVGTGKTTLLRSALASFDATHIHSCYIFNPRLEVLEMLEFILADFGVPFEARTKSGMLIALNKWLIERFRDQETCVIVIDEAQNLSMELLEEIRLLTNLETSSEKLLQIVLAGQPELEDKLRQPALRQLRQRVSLWCRTRSNTAGQTEEYIAERLRIAGAEKPIFQPDAIQAVHRASRGVPRVINLICEYSLIHAYVDQQHQISVETVEDVVKDLELEPRQFNATKEIDQFAQAQDAGRQDG